MVEVYNEDEQVEQIKAWIKEYVPTILITVIVVAIAFFGWRYWEGNKETQRAVASSHFEAMLTSMMGNDSDGVKSQGQNLIKNYSSTPYAKLAALLLAKVDVQNHRYKMAESRLNWVIKKGESNSIKQVARNRAARVYIVMNNPKKAIELLQTVNDKSYLPAVNAIRGDAYLAMNDKINAKKCYENALKALPKSQASWPLLEMKLNQLASDSHRS